MRMSQLFLLFPSVDCCSWVLLRLRHIQVLIIMMDRMQHYSRLRIGIISTGAKAMRGCVVRASHTNRRSSNSEQFSAKSRTTCSANMHPRLQLRVFRFPRAVNSSGSPFIVLVVSSLCICYCQWDIHDNLRVDIWGKDKSFVEPALLYLKIESTPCLFDNQKTRDEIAQPLYIEQTCMYLPSSL